MFTSFHLRSMVADWSQTKVNMFDIRHWGDTLLSPSLPLHYCCFVCVDNEDAKDLLSEILVEVLVLIQQSAENPLKGLQRPAGHSSTSPSKYTSHRWDTTTFRYLALQLHQSQVRYYHIQIPHPRSTPVTGEILPHSDTSPSKYTWHRWDTTTFRHLTLKVHLTQVRYYHIQIPRPQSTPDTGEILPHSDTSPSKYTWHRWDTTTFRYLTLKVHPTQVRYYHIQIPRPPTTPVTGEILPHSDTSPSKYTSHRWDTTTFRYLTLKVHLTQVRYYHIQIPHPQSTPDTGEILPHSDTSPSRKQQQLLLNSIQDAPFSDHIQTETLLLPVKNVIECYTMKLTCNVQQKALRVKETCWFVY